MVPGRFQDGDLLTDEWTVGKNFGRHIRTRIAHLSKVFGCLPLALSSFTLTHTVEFPILGHHESRSGSKVSL